MLSQHRFLQKEPPIGMCGPLSQGDHTGVQEVSLAEAALIARVRQVRAAFPKEEAWKMMGSDTQTLSIFNCSECLWIL